MNELLIWITTTEAGQLTARAVLMLCGLGIWANLIVLANYLPREAVHLHTAVLIVAGVAAGGGAAHAGFINDLPGGAVFLALSTASLLLLLIGVVGTPKSMCVRLEKARSEA